MLGGVELCWWGGAMLIVGWGNEADIRVSGGNVGWGGANVGWGNEAAIRVSGGNVGWGGVMLG